MTWNFPLLRKLINFYKNYGLINTILFVIFVFLGTKIIIINGFIYAANFLFGFGWKYAPVLDYLNLMVYL
tara:strand:- start:2652 stop:2861 length:210 start_codon:yes stop_codon:yes gene_type:complete